MNPVFITTLSHRFINDFYELFEKVMNEDYSLYSASQKQYFLDKLYSKQFFRRNIENQFNTVFIAFLNNKICGFLIADKIFGGVAFVNWIGVDKLYRNKGVATALLNYSEDF